MYITDDEVEIISSTNSDLIGKTGFVNFVDGDRVWISIWNGDEDTEVLLSIHEIDFRKF